MIYIKCMDNKYFIFLDIDGTLWDFRDNPFMIMHSTHFNKDSVQAVNLLISGLKEKNYEPNLIIIGQLRENWDKCKAALYDQGLNCQVPLYPLSIGKFSRGERISLFLHDFYHGKDVNSTKRNFSFADNVHKHYNKKLNNYVVIDDNISHLHNIPTSHIIETNMLCRALNSNLVNDFLLKTPAYNNEPEM